MSVDRTEADLKMFIAAALTGICANPSFNNPQTQNYLKAKGLTQEKLAILSGVNIMEELEHFRAELSKDESKKGLVIVDSPL